MELLLSTEAPYSDIRSSSCNHTPFPLRSLFHLRYAGSRKEYLDTDLVFIRLCRWLSPISYDPAPPGWVLSWECRNLPVLILLEQHAGVPREAAFLALLQYEKVPFNVSSDRSKTSDTGS